MRKAYPEPFEREGTPFYYFAVVEGKRRRVLSTGETGKEAARARIREYVDLRAGGASRLIFREYSAPYFRPESCPRAKRRQSEGRTVGTVYLKSARSVLDRWVLTDPIFPDLVMAEITRGHVLDLRDRLRERAPGNTAGKALAAAKVVLAEAAFRGELEADPGAHVGIAAFERKARGAFTAAEVAAILAAQPADMGKSALADATVTLLFCSGARAGELRALRWCDLQGRRLRIERAFKDHHGTLGPPKTSRARELLLPRLAVDRLERWRAASPHTGPEDWIFAMIDGDALGITGLKNLFARVLEAAEKAKLLKRGDRWLTPHSARATLNTALLSAGLSPLLIGTYLGWTSAEAKLLGRVQGQHYTRLELLDLRSVAAKIDELYGPKRTHKKQLDTA